MRTQPWVLVAAATAVASLASAEPETRPRIYYPRAVKRQIANVTSSSDVTSEPSTTSIQSTTRRGLLDLLSGLDPDSEKTSDVEVKPTDKDDDEEDEEDEGIILDPSGILLPGLGGDDKETTKPTPSSTKDKESTSTKDSTSTKESDKESTKESSKDSTSTKTSTKTDSDDEEKPTSTSKSSTSAKDEDESSSTKLIDLDPILTKLLPTPTTSSTSEKESSTTKKSTTDKDEESTSTGKTSVVSPTSKTSSSTKLIDLTSLLPEPSTTESSTTEKSSTSTKESSVTTDEPTTGVSTTDEPTTVPTTTPLPPPSSTSTSDDSSIVTTEPTSIATEPTVTPEPTPEPIPSDTTTTSGTTDSSATEADPSTETTASVPSTVETEPAVTPTEPATETSVSSGSSTSTDEEVKPTTTPKVEPEPSSTTSKAVEPSTTASTTLRPVTTTKKPEEEDDDDDDWLPTTIVREATTTDATTTATGTGKSSSSATSLPSSMPKFILPDEPDQEQPEGTVPIQIGFLKPLNFKFVSKNSVAAAQIFKYLPNALADAGKFPRDKVIVRKLIPMYAPAMDYPITIAQAWFPENMIDALQMQINAPNSGLYHNSRSIVNALTEVIDPRIDLQGNIEAENGGAAGGNGGSGSGSDSNNDAFDDNSDNDDSGKTAKDRATTAGIALGALSLAGLYGAAMFIVARRYKRKRQGHQRTSSIGSSQASSEMRYNGNGSPALMGGALMNQNASNYGGVQAHGNGRDSQNSGQTYGQQSARTANISAPVATENSLGWN